ncbi:Di-copper centre-containing protein [Polychaeton citri CBS 116435]|uniref:tyrosinase n=1 Tax=Polychaeton citri CBS 116435 TaxID=1314669 RepID=A0A9P4QDB0_9PEZI|nr:Di-copper centre-containing protein [Polychaeton citri CBS 116435]
MRLARRQSGTDNNTAGSTYPITGVGQFGVQPRLEIRQLQQNVDQFNLYILALQRMMQADEDDLLSHYSIAGIHGRPYVPWNNLKVQGVAGGYCQHTANVFLPWHRPYMLLYEQVLQQYIVEIVNTFPTGVTRRRYAQAALEWRLPYWDWAMDPLDTPSMIPSIVQQPTVQVTLPNGTATIDNPLYAYTFHPSAPLEAFYWTPYNEWQSTIRAPTNKTSYATSQDSVSSQNVYAVHTMLKDRLYSLFTNYGNFTQFGNQASLNHDSQHSDSLEKLHNVVHDKSGSQGTMTFLEFSAHDPLFFLHHTFIDRCFALWQALYPDSWVEPMDAVESTMMVLAGQSVDADSPLWPFSTDEKATWFTSNSVRDWTTWGYTYPELVDGWTPASVRSAINKLYGNSASNLIVNKRDTNAANVPGWLVNGKRSEYTVNIDMDMSAINGTFTVYLFLGDFDSRDPTCWPTEANLVGVDSSFGGFKDANTADEARTPVIVSGSVPLTTKLLKKVDSGELFSMEESEVEHYLTENLQWRLTGGDGTEITSDQVTGLVVSVVANNVTPACSADEFPAWGTAKALHNATQGRLGGAAA